MTSQVVLFVEKTYGVSVLGVLRNGSNMKKLEESRPLGLSGNTHELASKAVSKSEAKSESQVVFKTFIRGN